MALAALSIRKETKIQSFDRISKFDYIYRENSCKFHIRDEEIAKTLYNVILNKELDITNIPEEFSDMKGIFALLKETYSRKY